MAIHVLSLFLHKFLAGIFDILAQIHLGAEHPTCMVIRRRIGFEILRVQLGTVELLVYLLETIEKNAVNGHFPRFFSDLPVLYHKLHVICDTKPSGLLLGACKFFWRQHCNKTTCVLKRRVTASCRFQNYQKRLITFGDTARNVKLFFRKQNSGNTYLPSPESSLNSFRARNSSRKLTNQCTGTFPQIWTG